MPGQTCFTPPQKSQLNRTIKYQNNAAVIKIFYQFQIMFKGFIPKLTAELFSVGYAVGGGLFTYQKCPQCTLIDQVQRMCVLP